MTSITRLKPVDHGAEHGVLDCGGTAVQAIACLSPNKPPLPAPISAYPGPRALGKRAAMR
jgi:hypothetical protein